MLRVAVITLRADDRYNTQHQKSVPDAPQALEKRGTLKPVNTEQQLYKTSGVLTLYTAQKKKIPSIEKGRIATADKFMLAVPAHVVMM